MPINLNVTPAQAPEGTCFTGVQDLINKVSQFLQVSIPEQLGFGLFSFGSSTPSVDRQGFPWFQLNADGTPFDINVFVNGAWTGFGINRPLPQETADLRLTLVSGSPVTTSDSSGNTLYLTPYKGNIIALFDGSKWAYTTFTEISKSTGTLSADTNHDVFAYLSAGVLTMNFVAWTNGTTRATALSFQDGVYVNSGDVTQRYVGTIRTTSSAGTVADSVTQRFVWNFYNRQLRRMTKSGPATSYSYTSTTYRQANADTAFKLELVIGVKDTFQVKYSTGMGGAGANAGIGIGIDSITSATFKSGCTSASVSYLHCGGFSDQEGYHYFSAMESGNTGITYAGDATSVNPYEYQRIEGVLQA